MDKEKKSSRPHPNILLRREREARNWTLQDVADKLYELCLQEGRESGISSDTVGRWERGISRPEAHYRAKLCKLYESDARKLGLIEELEHTADFSVPRENGEDVLEGILQPHAEGEDDMDRRQTLQVLGAAGLMMSLPALTNLEELEKYLQRRSARLHTWVLESLEDGTRLRWQLYYTSKNSLTEEGLFKQIERLEQLADEGVVQESRVYSVLIQNYQLAGSLARDAFHYTKAKKYFLESHRLAEDLRSPDLTSTAVARHALALMRQAGTAEMNDLYGKRIAEALALYQSANDLAAHAEPHVRAYILSGLAEALARNGYSDGCYRSLDKAEQLLNASPVIAPEDDLAHVRLTLQSLEDARGECYVLLGEPKKGLEYLQKAYKQLDPTISRNLCRVLMQQAEAYLAAGYPDQCVSCALQGLQVARILESASSINWSREIHQKLLQSRWKDESVVRELALALAG